MSNTEGDDDSYDPMAMDEYEDGPAGPSFQHHGGGPREGGGGSGGGHGGYHDEGYYPSPTHAHHRDQRGNRQNQGAGGGDRHGYPRNQRGDGGDRHGPGGGDKVVDQDFFNEFNDDFDDEDLE